MKVLRSLLTALRHQRLAFRALVLSLGFGFLLVGGDAVAASAQTTTTVPLDPVAEATSLATTAAPIAGEVLVAVAGAAIGILLLWWGIGKVWGMFRAQKPKV